MSWSSVSVLSLQILLKLILAINSAQLTSETYPLERCGFVSPSSFVTLMRTKSLCDCPSCELFSDGELSSFGRGSSSALGCPAVPWVGKQKKFMKNYSQVEGGKCCNSPVKHSNSSVCQKHFKLSTSAQFRLRLLHNFSRTTLARLDFHAHNSNCQPRRETKS